MDVPPEVVTGVLAMILGGGAGGALVKARENQRHEAEAAKVPVDGEGKPISIEVLNFRVDELTRGHKEWATEGRARLSGQDGRMGQFELQQNDISNKVDTVLATQAELKDMMKELAAKRRAPRP